MPSYVRRWKSILDAKKKRNLDAVIEHAYSKADEWLDEVEALVGAQAWPAT